jgi:hypothetical protein
MEENPMTKDGNDSKKDLAARVAELERQVRRLTRRGGGAPAHGDAMHFCSVPQLPPREMGPNVSAERARLIRYGGRKWVNDQMEIVREGFEVWKNVGIGLKFDEVHSPDDAEVRIGFLPNDGYWSYVGTDVLEIGQNERTMNFGYDLTLDSRGVDVPVHEIGHTLGFPHEHQNPFAGIVWDEEAVYDYFGGSPNFWDRDTILHNILRKIPQGTVEGSEWDPDSIMHYDFAAGLIEHPEEYQSGLHPAPGLSDIDREQVRFFYPRPAPSHPELRPFELQRLSLSPGEQADFSIAPTATREYQIQTFGYTDSVMVLFEDRDGDYQYVAGDDDSGWDRNATLSLRLYADRKYVVRIRLYYQWASGETALMMW